MVLINHFAFSATILSAAVIKEMKDSAALLHISLHRENNLYGRLVGDVGKNFKKKSIFT